MSHPRRSPQETGSGAQGISSAGTILSPTLPLAFDTSSSTTAASSTTAPKSLALVSSSSNAVNTPTKSATAHSSLSTYGGEIAGIAIGSAIVGSFLTIIMFWLWMSKSSRRKDSIDEFLMLQPSDKPTPPAKDSAPTLDESLPKEMEEKALINGMQDLSRLIENHVDDHIALTQIPGPEQTDVLTIQANVEKALRVYIDNSSQMPIDELSALLMNAQGRKSAARYLIGWTLMSGIAKYGDPRRTLLPSELIIFMNQIPPPTADWQLFQEALSKWRTISAFLLFPSNATSQNPRREKELSINTLRIKNCLNDTLRPFYNTQEDSQSRDDDLAVLVRKTAEFGLLLFSQPISWSVQWQDVEAQLGPVDEDERLGVLGSFSNHHRNLVVFPGLEKIAIDKQTGALKRTPVKVLSAELDRNIEIGPAYRIPSIQIGMAS